MQHFLGSAASKYFDPPEQFVCRWNYSATHTPRFIQSWCIASLDLVIRWCPFRVCHSLLKNRRQHRTQDEFPFLFLAFLSSGRLSQKPERWNKLRPRLIVFSSCLYLCTDRLLRRLPFSWLKKVLLFLIFWRVIVNRTIVTGGEKGRDSTLNQHVCPPHILRLIFIYCSYLRLFTGPLTSRILGEVSFWRKKERNGHHDYIHVCPFY